MSDDSNKHKKNEDFPILGNNQSCDCGPNECCPGDSMSKGQSYRAIKTVVFIAVMLAAVVVGAYSLIENGSEADNPPAIAIEDQVVDPLASQRFDFIKDFIGDGEMAYLTLNGAGAALNDNERVAALVDEAAALLDKKGVRVKTASVFPGDSIFSRVVELYEVKALPLVLAMKSSGQSIIIDSAITENSLLTAYISGCSPASACAPGCDPKDCGN